MKKLTIFLKTLIVLGSVGLVAALIYFLTIFGGLALLGVGIFLLIAEYYKDEPKDGP